MNETEFYQKMIETCAVNDKTIERRACAPVARKGRAWKRAAAIALASAAVLVGTVFAIPSARAEVLGWFRSAPASNRISDYLAGDETKRSELPELAPLVATPDPNEDAVTIPIDRTENNAVNGEKALEISAFLQDNCDVSLGDALYDGEEIFQSVRLNGLSGLYLLEQRVGGVETSVPVDPEKMTGMYEDSELEAYRTGERTLLEYPSGKILYEMPDGSRHGGTLALTDAIDSYERLLAEQGLILPEGELSEAQLEQLHERNRAYLNENGVVAVAQIVPVSEDWEHYWEQFTDADGNMTVKVFYAVSVIEEDRGTEEYVHATDLYAAELGTITVNMHAYRDMPQKEVENTDSLVAAWAPEEIVMSLTEAVWNSNAYVGDTFTKYRVSMEGVTLRMEAEHAAINPLGIRNLKIRVTVPDSWTDEQREALLYSLQFQMLINGKEIRGYTMYHNVQQDGSILWTFGELLDDAELPSAIESISFCPKIVCIDKWIEYAGSPDREEILREVDPPIGETVVVDFEHGIWAGRDTTTEYPQYTVTLTLH